MRPIIVGNWKMHGLSAKLKDIETLSAWAVGRRPSADVIVCLPATLIEHAARIAAACSMRVAMWGRAGRSPATSAPRC
jgi:triosephosphate isomerase